MSVRGGEGRGGSSASRPRAATVGSAWAAHRRHRRRLASSVPRPTGVGVVGSKFGAGGRRDVRAGRAGSPCRSRRVARTAAGSRYGIAEGSEFFPPSSERGQGASGQGGAAGIAVESPEDENARQGSGSRALAGDRLPRAPANGLASRPQVGIGFQSGTAGGSVPSASRRRTQASKRGHSARIVGSPICPATIRPWRALL